MPLSLIALAENTSGFHNILYTQLAPGDVLRIPLSENPDLLAVNYDVVAVYGHFCVKDAVVGVVLQEVCQVLASVKSFTATILEIRISNSSPQYQAADTVKPVNTNFNRHHDSPYSISFKLISLRATPSSVMHTSQ